MLINVKHSMDRQLQLITSLISGGNNRTTLIHEGVYEIGHFSFDHALRNYYKIDEYPNIPVNGNNHAVVVEDYVGCYGVCDNYQQILEQTDIEKSDRKFVIAITPIRKSDQPSDGGWRWHEWDEYIGTQQPSGCEYLYNEPTIEQVYVYHIYEIKQ